MFNPPNHHEVKTPVVLIAGKPGGGSFQVTFGTIVQVAFVETEEKITVSYLIKLQDGNVGPAPEGCEIVKLSGRAWDSQSVGTALLDRSKPPEPVEAVAAPVVVPAVDPPVDDGYGYPRF